MSRLQTGSVVPHLAPVGLDAAVAGALVGLPGAGAVEVDVPEDLPAVTADAGLLERVIANIVENALKHDRGGVRISGSTLGPRVELRVVDRGPGVRDEDKGRIFEPFQRLGDAPGRSGVGLGLAVARGFTEAMDGQLDAEDTPGGVRLTPTEWHVLEVLVRHSGRLVTQRQLLKEVWGPAYEKETNYLRVYLAQLRRKLEPDPARPRHLLTVAGQGYRFEP
jgi:signal transduction histidine kinase